MQSAQGFSGHRIIDAEIDRPGAIPGRFESMGQVIGPAALCELCALRVCRFGEHRQGWQKACPPEAGWGQTDERQRPLAAFFYLVVPWGRSVVANPKWVLLQQIGEYPC